MTVKNVRFMCGQYAYACIDLDTGRVDIKLSPGKSGAQSLREYAAQLEQDIALKQIKVQIARDAAQWLESRK